MLFSARSGAKTQSSVRHLERSSPGLRSASHTTFEICYVMDRSHRKNRRDTYIVIGLFADELEPKVDVRRHVILPFPYRVVSDAVVSVPVVVISYISHNTAFIGLHPGIGSEPPGPVPGALPTM
jgi:hypothetical protein